MSARKTYRQQYNEIMNGLGYKGAEDGETITYGDIKTSLKFVRAMCEDSNYKLFALTWGKNKDVAVRRSYIRAKHLLAKISILRDEIIAL